LAALSHPDPVLSRGDDDRLGALGILLELLARLRHFAAQLLQLFLPLLRRLLQRVGLAADARGDRAVDPLEARDDPLVTQVRPLRCDREGGQPDGDHEERPGAEEPDAIAEAGGGALAHLRRRTRASEAGPASRRPRGPPPAPGTSRAL